MSGHSTSKRISGHPARRVAIVVLAAAVSVWLLLGLCSIPEDAVGVLDSVVRHPRAAGPGIHWALPGLETMRVLDPYLRHTQLDYRTPEGARLELQLRVALRLTPEGVDALWSTVDEPDPMARLDRVIDEFVSERIHVLADESIPRLDEGMVASIAAALSRFGEVEGELVLEYHEDSPVAMSLRSNEEWERIRGLVRNTGARVLLVGVDGMDWQIADPLIERGLLPNLANLRDRGAWGNVRALMPILSPLLWTSVATGVTPDRHGIVDFLVSDPAGGEPTPVNSRYRKVRALWNLYSEAGLSADVIAWWASWPAEPINGHLISDRVSYSLFDVEAPSYAHGITHPPGYFDQIRAALISDDAIGLADVLPFVDITESEFARARARIEIDRESAYREPVNHLTKILAATRNYHRIALDLLTREQANFTAVYYQLIDEVCHRFIHFSPPRMTGVDPRDVRRFGHAVQQAYVYQDQILGELLAAADPDSIVIVLSDHGFLNGASRIAGETADVEGRPGRWHRRYGVLLLAGPPIIHRELETSSLLDIAPTVLYLSGLPVSDDLDGEVLIDAIEPEFVRRFPENRIASYEVTPFRVGGVAGGELAAAAAEEFLENLRSLGYIGGAEAAPSSLSSHVNLAATLIASGKLERAEQEILAALRLDPDHPRARKLLFNVRYRQARFDDAIEIARGLIDGPEAGDSRFVTRLARAYRRAGRLEAGSREYGARVESGEERLGALYCRLLFEGGDTKGAERAARAVLASDPLNEAAMDTVFNIAVREGRLSELEPLLQTALDANGRSVAHLNYLSFVRENQGNLPEAERLLVKALEFDPEHGSSLINLARVRSRQGRDDAAVPLLKRALRANPDNYRARVDLGAALAGAGRLDEAIAEYRRVVDEGHGSARVFNALAQIRLSQGDRDSAILWYRRSLETNAEQDDVRRTLQRIESGASPPTGQ